MTKIIYIDSIELSQTYELMEGYIIDNGNLKINQSEKILNAALKCISTKGYATVSLRDIADEAGVALSQVNYYYKNKEGLFIEVIKTVAQIYSLELEDCLKRDDTSKDKLTNLTNYFHKILKNDSELTRVMFDFVNMSIWSETFGNLLSSLFKEMSDIIEKYVFHEDIFTNTNFNNYSTTTISRMTLGLLLGTSIQFVLDPKEESIAESLDIIHEVFYK